MMMTCFKMEHMAQLIDCWAVREARPDVSSGMKCHCANCGADLWHISRSGEVSCADCDEPSNQHVLIRNDC